MKLIIPMAGRGTRVRPHSHVTPKPLLSVRGTSIVERIVDTFSEAIEANIDTGVFVLGPDFGQGVRDDLTDICARNDMEAQFAVQEEALGTAHAVGSAAEYLSGSGIVVFADTLFGMTLLAFLVSVEEVARELPAALRGRPDVSFSNVVGSVLAFFGFNAGVIALLRPVPVGATTRFFYLPVCAATLLLIVVLMTVGRVPRWGGALLLGLYVVFVAGPLL